jgi:hypothetical protein
MEKRIVNIDFYPRGQLQITYFQASFDANGYLKNQGNEETLTLYPETNELNNISQGLKNKPESPVFRIKLGRESFLCERYLVEGINNWF